MIKRHGMSEFKLSHVIATFHQGSQSLTQFFAEQGHSDDDMLLAFDQIDQFLVKEENNLDQRNVEDFNRQGNELISVIDRLMVFSANNEHNESFSYFEQFLFLFSLWFAQSGGTISQLIPLVNLIAALSNRLRDNISLQQLLANIEIIIKAIKQSIQDDMEDRDPRRPWRVLLLNYAITATRTHDILLMEKAFQLLIYHLPDDLVQFFTEGMSQMTALDYPQPVKELMNQYYSQYGNQKMSKN
jgi:hypothetical protein